MVASFCLLVDPEGLEPSTTCVSGRYSDQLSYGSLSGSLYATRLSMSTRADKKIPRRPKPAGGWLHACNLVRPDITMKDRVAFRVFHFVGHRHHTEDMVDLFEPVLIRIRCLTVEAEELLGRSPLLTSLT